MDKLITFAIPSYNSGAFMHNCIDSILGAGDDIEILIINDGSKDNTGEVADRYAAEYPDIVRAIHQENGGHGEGVNQGMRNARGLYYKVVDSDDRLDPEELQKFLTRLREMVAAGEGADMYVCNYVYVRVDTGVRRSMNYKNIFPREQTCTWEDTHHFGPSQYLMMHSVVYRTALLREHNIELPKHTFYVDNLYMYAPFPYVESIYYMDLDLYLYYVGGDEQSVSEKNMVKRIDQQILVTKLMVECHDLNALKQPRPRLYRYMMHELSMMFIICDSFLALGGTKEHIAKKKELWAHLKKHDRRTYRKLRHESLAGFTALPGPLGRRFTVRAYKIARRHFQFN